MNDESTPLISFKTHVETEPHIKNKSPKYIKPLLETKPFIKFRNFVSQSDHKSEYHVEDQLLIFRINGSIWPRVLPWCMFNTFIGFVVRYFHRYSTQTLDFSFNSSGHAFMGTLISFLVISQSTNAYWGWIGTRQRAKDLMRNFRELIHLALTFTRHDNSHNATRWRFEVSVLITFFLRFYSKFNFNDFQKVSRRAIILLRVIVSVLEYDRKEQNIWQLPELTPQEKKAVLHSVGGEIERAPVILSLFLRTAIGSHVKYLKNPLDVNEELKCLECTSNIMSSYYQMMMLLNTPFPFPLEQMVSRAIFIFN